MKEPQKKKGRPSRLIEKPLDSISQIASKPIQSGGVGTPVRKKGDNVVYRSLRMYCNLHGFDYTYCTKSIHGKGLYKGVAFEYVPELLWLFNNNYRQYAIYNGEPREHFTIESPFDEKTIDSERNTRRKGWNMIQRYTPEELSVILETGSSSPVYLSEEKRHPLQTKAELFGGTYDSYKGVVYFPKTKEVKNLKKGDWVICSNGKIAIYGTLSDVLKRVSMKYTELAYKALESKLEPFKNKIDVYHLETLEDWQALNEYFRLSKVKEVSQIVFKDTQYN